MMTNGPSATIGEILDVRLPRPRRRPELATDRSMRAAGRRARSSSTGAAPRADAGCRLGDVGERVRRGPRSSGCRPGGFESARKATD